MIFKKIISSFILMALPLILTAQTAGSEIEMADTMRSNGKIYVVVAVVTVIMTGLIIYLISLDRKITKIEKRISSRNQS